MNSTSDKKTTKFEFLIDSLAKQIELNSDHTDTISSKIRNIYSEPTEEACKGEAVERAEPHTVVDKLDVLINSLEKINHRQLNIISTLSDLI